MRSSRKLILVHRNMEQVTLDTSVDIMITPQFYTMKKEALPVKYAYRARKVAPSLFEGLLEGHSRYDYFVFWQGEKWVFIAYNTEEIMAFLEEKGIAPEKVSKLFFAQQALEHFTTPLSLGEKEVLAVFDDTVVVVPRLAVAKQEYATFNEQFRPNKGIQLERGSALLLSKKQAVVLAVAFSLFGVVWIAEGWRYKKSNIELQAEQNELYKTYPALQSAYSRKSIAKKYHNIDRLERRKREIIEKISGLIFKGVTLTDFELDPKGFKVVFVTRDKRVAKRLDDLLKSAGFSKSSRFSNNEIVVKGKL